MEEWQLFYIIFNGIIWCLIAGWVGAEILWKYLDKKEMELIENENDTKRS